MGAIVSPLDYISVGEVFLLFSLRKGGFMDDAFKPSRVSTACAAAIAFLGWHSAAAAHLKKKHGATLLQYWILLIFQFRSCLCVKDMHQELELNYTTVAECVSVLASDGFVSKRDADNDGREVAVTITPRGRERFEELDSGLIDFSLELWKSHPSDVRKRVFPMFHESCKLHGKERMMGSLARGDTAFIIVCAQFTMEFKKACSKMPLPANHAKTLLLIADLEGSVHPSELAEILAERPSGVSKTLSQMEKDGLISRQRGACRRKRDVELTALGTERAAGVRCAVEEILATSFVDAGENALLSSVLYELADQLRCR